MTKTTVCSRLCRASRRGTGLHLSPDDVQVLLALSPLIREHETSKESEVATFADPISNEKGKMFYAKSEKLLYPLALVLGLNPGPDTVLEFGQNSENAWHIQNMDTRMFAVLYGKSGPGMRYIPELAKAKTTVEALRIAFRNICRDDTQI